MYIGDRLPNVIPSQKKEGEVLPSPSSDKLTQLRDYSPLQKLRS